MAGLQHEQFFTDGINTDVVDNLMSNKQARYMLNVRTANTDRDNVGAVELIQGNELVSISLPPGTNRCIGQRKDDQFSIYFMVYNSLGNHSIWRYDIDVNAVAPVLVPQTSPLVPVNTRFLNFQDDPRYRILSFDIIRDGNGYVLGYWTDGWVDDISLPYDRNIPSSLWSLRPYNRPRALNFTLSANMCAGILPRYPFDLGTSNFDIQNQYLDRARRMPYQGPAVEFRSDPSRNTNYFRGKSLPQFSYRYRYMDGTTSVWSPLSEVALPFNDENLRGVNTFNSFENNFVRLTYDTGHSSAIQIDFAVRFGNNGNWNLFDTIDKYDLSDPSIFPSVVLIGSYGTAVYDFYNDRVLRTIAEQELIPESLVPTVSRNHIIVQDNRLVDGGIIEGRDAVALDVEVLSAPVGAGLAKPSASFNTPALNIIPNTWSWGSDFYAPASHLDVPVGTYVSFSFLVGITPPLSPYQIQRIVTSADVANQSAYIAFLTGIIQEANLRTGVTSATVPNLFTDSVSGVSALRLFPQAITAPTIFVSRTVVVESPITKIPSFKLGAHHKFAIIYMDEIGVRGAANTEQRMSVYVPFYSEDPQLIGVPYETNTYSGFATQMNIIIKNAAPKWARKYMIAYSGSNITYFVQFPVIANVTFDSNGNALVNANSLIKFYIPNNDPTQVQYTYQAGDRIRFITNRNGNVLSQYVDVRINELRDVSGDWFFVCAPFNITLTDIGTGSIAEVYRTSNEPQEGEEIVFEFAKVFDVNYEQASNVWYHSGNNGNQSPTNLSGVPAQVALDRGDVYVKRRAYKDQAGNAIQLPIPVEAQQFSDFYPSSDIDIGRASVILPNARQRFLFNELLHSDIYFEGTTINGLSTVRATSRTSVPLTHGAITRMFEVGYVLKVIQETNINSVYIGRIQTFKADGTPELIATNTVFGTKIPSENRMGTTFPGSATVHDRHVYWFDAIRGEVIRDSANGQFAISNYGKISDFRNLGLALVRIQNQNPSAIDIQSTFDENLGCFVMTVIKLEQSIPDDIEGTFIFHKNSNSWRGNLGFIPEMWGGDKQYILAFRNGAPWRMHSPNVPAMNFFGVQQRARLTFVVNVAPNDVKVFDNVTLNSTTPWEFTDVNQGLTIRIPPNDQYPNGMQSRLLKSKFKGKEGKWHSEFLRNAVSAGNATLEQKLINGDTLRGYVMEITAECDATTSQTLFSIIVNCTPSNLSK